MKMMEPCLLTGPFDWSDAIIPRAEFDARLVRVRALMRAAGVEKLVAHGNAFDHGALAWLTGFTPKLGPAFALVPLEGPLRIVCSGGPGMTRSAKLLTFVEDVSALRGVGPDIGGWLGEAPAGGFRLGLCEGGAMAQAPWAALQGLVAGKGAIVEMDAGLDALRRARTPVEQKVMAQAIEILEATTRLAIQMRKKLGPRGLALAAEAAAMSFGAQDARFRVSARPCGPPAPPGDDDAKIDGPICLAMATRFYGSWACGQTMLGEIDAATRDTAGAALRDGLSRLRAGAPAAAILDAGVSGHGVGLCLEEAPRFDGADVLVAGDVVSLVARVAAGESGGASWSLLARVASGDARVLWAAPNLGFTPGRE